MAERFTKRQGEYLTFIHLYMTLNNRAPAETDFQAYFGVSAPAVHQMIVSLENRGLIQRTPGLARSIRLLVPPEALPSLERAGQTGLRDSTFAERFPNIAFWVTQHGWIELGYDHNTDTCARAIDEGGMPWSGGDSQQTVEDWMQALETGIGECLDELGLK
jgi:SOS-response transcriptional repressor LexA